MRGFATRAVATLLSLSLAPGRAVGDAPPQVPLANGLPEPRTKGNPLNSVFKEYIDQIREDLHVPGLSIGVVDGDETYLAGYGNARLDPDVEVTPDTLFYIGSISKAITSASLFYVLESTTNTSRPVTLDSRIHDVIPDDFVLSDEYATLHATLKDALCHRLGYPRHDMSYGGLGFTVKDATRLLRHLPMTKELREEFQYFNYGYMIAQHVAESLSGKPLGALYEEAVFGPLGMSSTTVNLENATQRLAIGYGFNNITKQLHRQPWWDTRLIGPGGVISSARDFTKYIRAMINQDLPLSKDLQDALVTPLIVQSPVAPQYHSHALYAAGWGITYYRGHRLITHNGGIPGFTAITGYLPDDKWGAVVATNGDIPGTFVSEAAFYRLLDDFLDVSPHERTDVISKWDGYTHKKYNNYVNARKVFFPHVPKPGLPHALPLEEYSGTYFHPGYRNISLSVAEPADYLPVAETTKQVLHGLNQHEWNVVYDLEHVSGEHFVAYANSESGSPMLQEATTAEFVVGSNGKVSRLGVVIEPSLAENIWFDKIV